MNSLKKQVQAYNALLIASKTVEAMEAFYADGITMQENEMEPRVGKQFCIEHEKKNLSRVKALKIQILNQAIDEQAEVVFTEMEIDFTPLVGPTMKIIEVSVQHWKNGLVQKEKFYYKDVIKIG